MFPIKKNTKTITKTITTTNARVMCVNLETKSVTEKFISFVGEYTQKEIEKAVCGVTAEIDGETVVGVTVIEVCYLDKIYSCSIDDFLYVATFTGDYAELKRRSNA